MMFGSFFCDIVSIGQHFNVRISHSHSVHINEGERTHYAILCIQYLVFNLYLLQLSCLSPLLDDPTVQGLDKSRHLQTGEMIIIVVVLLMWAGKFLKTLCG